MKQKLAIIAAWIHDPKLILMDEPFVGLDPKAAHLLKGMMRAVCDGGGAIFFSTHVLEVAEKLCDKVAIIRSGQAHPLRHNGGGQGRRQPRGRVPRAGGCVMLKTLLKKQMAEIFRNYFYDAEKEQNALQGRDDRLHRAVCAADGGRARRDVRAAGRRHLRADGGGGRGLAVLSASWG